MTRAGSTDVPVIAHSKAVRTLDEFDELVSTYVAILDTQRAHAGTNHFDALTEALARGDTLAAQAAACGRRVAPLREVVESGRYTGPRARDLTERFQLAHARATVLGALTDTAADACGVLRDGAESALREGPAPAARGRNAYQPARSRTLALDRQG